MNISYSYQLPALCLTVHFVCTTPPRIQTSSIEKVSFRGGKPSIYFFRQCSITYHHLAPSNLNHKPRWHSWLEHHPLQTLLSQTPVDINPANIITPERSTVEFAWMNPSLPVEMVARRTDDASICLCLRVAKKERSQFVFCQHCLGTLTRWQIDL